MKLFLQNFGIICVWRHYSKIVSKRAQTGASRTNGDKKAKCFTNFHAPTFITTYCHDWTNKGPDSNTRASSGKRLKAIIA